MQWLTIYLPTIGMVLGTLTGAWAFLSKLDKSYRGLLRSEFATKEDFTRLEEKVDTMMLALRARQQSVKGKYPYEKWL
jgi:hypothetical protein